MSVIGIEMQIEAMMLDNTQKVGRVDHEKIRPQNGPLGHATGDQPKAGTAASKTNKLRLMVKVRPYPRHYPTGDAETTVQSLQQNLMVHHIKAVLGWRSRPRR